MHVIEYLMSCGNDNTIANTARVSFAGEEWSELPDGYTPKQRDGLIRYLAKHKHMSPFRHNSITIRAEEPIFLVRQLGKHQAGLSWNEVSRRYVSENITFHVPEKWREAPEGSIKQGSGRTHPHSKSWSYTYAEHCDKALDLYDTMIADNVAPEQARMVLPQSMNTTWVWTGNLLAFAHCYKERIAPNAQVEAQGFAKELDEIIRPLFPVSWRALVGD